MNVYEILTAIERIANSNNYKKRTTSNETRLESIQRISFQALRDMYWEGIKKEKQAKIKEKLDDIAGSIQGPI